jgi:hypothetical protein
MRLDRSPRRGSGTSISTHRFDSRVWLNY